MRRRLLIALAALVVVALLDIALVATLHKPKKTPGRPIAGATGIPGSDGVQLAGQTFVPRGSGKHALIVMPASWGANAQEYKVVGRELADQGYVVVAYAQRGFIPSQGQIDFAGTPTQQDVSSVITWALAHTPADPSAIGVMGVSYGGGMSLLAAEHDPRIKAVVAMSAWTDLQQSFFPNQTPNTQAIRSLFGSARSRFSPEVATFQRLFVSGNRIAAEAQLATMTGVRSAMTDVAALNRNHTAVMIANDFQDSYFAPNQLVTFFDKLTGPKRLQLAVGDHGSQELPGLQGGTSEVWVDGGKWMDHFLRGADNGIQQQDPIWMKDVAAGTWHTYKSWPSAGQAAYLTGNGDPGSLTTARGGTWSKTLLVGTPTKATSAPIQIGRYPYRPVTGIDVNALPPSGAGVWNGPALTAPLTVAGIPTVHLTVRPTSASATVFAYLYDTDSSGTASLITTAPYSITGATGAAPTAVDIPLRPIAWTVPAGDHLTLVVDTVDPRFTALGIKGHAVVISSAATDPARLEIPA
jgi:predicted acyl esterase